MCNSVTVCNSVCIVKCVCDLRQYLFVLLNVLLPPIGCGVVCVIEDCHITFATSFRIGVNLRLSKRFVCAHLQTL